MCGLEEKKSSGGRQSPVVGFGELAKSFFPGAFSFGSYSPVSMAQWAGCQLDLQPTSFSIGTPWGSRYVK